jgi:hypothetical protein
LASRREGLPASGAAITHKGVAAADEAVAFFVATDMIVIIIKENHIAVHLVVMLATGRRTPQTLGPLFRSGLSTFLLARCTQT